MYSLILLLNKYWISDSGFIKVINSWELHRIYLFSRVFYLNILLRYLLRDIVNTFRKVQDFYILHSNLHFIKNRNGYRIFINILAAEKNYTCFWTVCRKITDLVENIKFNYTLWMEFLSCETESVPILTELAYIFSVLCR